MSHGLDRQPCPDREFNADPVSFKQQICGTLVCISEFAFCCVGRGQLTRPHLIAWNLGCGFAQNVGQLIAFRFLAGLGGSAALSVRIAPPVRSVSHSFT